jgi:hypothetical protein
MAMMSLSAKEEVLNVATDIDDEALLQSIALVFVADPSARTQ